MASNQKCFCGLSVRKGAYIIGILGLIIGVCDITVEAKILSKSTVSNLNWHQNLCITFFQLLNALDTYTYYVL